MRSFATRANATCAATKASGRSGRRPSTRATQRCCRSRRCCACALSLRWRDRPAGASHTTLPLLSFLARPSQISNQTGHAMSCHASPGTASAPACTFCHSAQFGVKERCRACRAIGGASGSRASDRRTLSLQRRPLRKAIGGCGRAQSIACVLQRAEAGFRGDRRALGLGCGCTPHAVTLTPGVRSRLGLRRAVRDGLTIRVVLCSETGRTNKRLRRFALRARSRIAPAAR